jgi:hypothetical protein
MKKTGLFLCVALSLFAASCDRNHTLLKLIPSSESGIEFQNSLTASDSLNVIKYEYFYNGASVSVSDFNNDGLSDLFFTGNMVSNKLYLNRGNLKFEDVSEIAAIENKGRWNAGSAVADVNNDGLPDIYVCTNGNSDSTKRPNSLFINQGLNKQGIPVFKDMAKEFGVEEFGYSQNAAFLDYDKDGDLDLYVLTNYVGINGPATYHPKITDGSADNNDQLYRNNGDYTFTNVTIEAGIVYEGYGLGIAIADINLDGYPDIYIGNDYITNDLIYINNQDGTFSNQAKYRMKHQARFSMGNDISDINNDGLVDIFTLDMLPSTNYRKKTSVDGGGSYMTYTSTEKLGYEYQYMRNMLQINNGDAPFSEIGQMLGLYQTEWSWSPLFLDIDNDGNKDLLITTGFPKDLTNIDYIRFKNDVGMFTKSHQLISVLPELKLPNYGYKNNGDLTFTDNSLKWGLGTPSYSNGAAFADLDNDGDLDYIVTNIDDKVHLYENTLYSHRSKKSDPHYLRLKLNGKFKGGELGTKITLFTEDGKKQYCDYSIYRGYLSTMENFVHFGLGNHTSVSKLEIIWPDGNTQVMQDIKADQLLVIDYNDAKVPQPTDESLRKDPEQKYFKEITSGLGISYKHYEMDQIDYYIQRTLPHKFSQSGPGLAVGDINRDDLEDFIVGGSSFYNATIFTQNENGKFIQSELVKGIEKYNEDEGFLLFDADNDNDLDLYVVSGSYESPAGNERYKDRLYLNDGKGKFSLSAGLIPDETTSGSCVRAADFDGDGDLDLFVGGRVITGSYPFSPPSYILRNDGGKFTDATREICSSLSAGGMITDAIWTDYDNNGTIDLITVGEFMAITLYKNTGSVLIKAKNSGIEKYSGWWNSITGADFDKDGDTDYVVGNLGLNNNYNISIEEPLRVYAKDFDNNGSIDAILSCYFKSNTGEMVEYPVHSLDMLSGQIPNLKNQFPTYSKFGETTMKQLLSLYHTDSLLQLQANYPLTSYMENLGNGKFTLKPLPMVTQYAPVNGLQTDDINNDGNLDLILVGNDFGNEIISGRYDALNGAVLLGDGRGEFSTLSSMQSGFLVPGDAKALSRLNSKLNDLFIATQNKDSLMIYVKNVRADNEMKVYKPLSSDSWAELVYKNGQTEKVEFYFGAGYLTQSTRTVSIPGNVEKIIIHGFNGKSRNIDPASLQMHL